MSSTEYDLRPIPVSANTGMMGYQNFPSALCSLHGMWSDAYTCVRRYWHKVISRYAQTYELALYPNAVPMLITRFKSPSAAPTRCSFLASTIAAQRHRSISSSRPRTSDTTPAIEEVVPTGFNILIYPLRNLQESPLNTFPALRARLNVLHDFILLAPLLRFFPCDLPLIWLSLVCCHR